MKRVFLLILTLGLIIPSSFSQVYEKGDFVIETYIGGPNFSTFVVREAYKLSDYFDRDLLTIKSVSPFGVRAEYLLSEQIGIGLNFNYASTKVSGEFKEPFDGNIFKYEASLPRWRVIPSIFLHLNKKTDKIDPYFSFGVGYVNAKFKEKIDDPYFKYGSLDFNLSGLAIRGEFGLRYFFIPNLGIHGQLGVGGGPLYAIGLTGKF